MSRFLTSVRRAERKRDLRPDLKLQPPHAPNWGDEQPFRVLTIANNKGGVGKTMLAANLAVYLRAMHEDLPILVLNLDDQVIVDDMFALEAGEKRGESLADGLERRNFSAVLRFGQYGIYYVPSPRSSEELERALGGVHELADALWATEWRGLVIVDTKSNLGMLTQNALAASDLVLVPVRDHSSVFQAAGVFKLLERWGRPRETARVVLSMMDPRIQYTEGEHRDVMALLLQEIRDRDFPLLESFVSASPLAASLLTNPQHRVRSAIHNTPRSVVHRQLAQLAEDVWKLIENTSAATLAAASARRRR